MGSGGTAGQQSQGTVASSASDKQRALTYMEQTLLPDTRTAGSMGEGGGAVHPPMVAPAPTPIFNDAKPDTGLAGLSAWASDSGLSAAMTVWRGQAGRLMGRLQGELNALRGTKNLFQTQDHGTGTDLGVGTNPLVTNPLIGTNPAFGTNPVAGNPLVTNPLIGTDPAAGNNPVAGTDPPLTTNPVFQPLPSSIDQM